MHRQELSILFENAACGKKEEKMKKKRFTAFILSIATIFSLNMPPVKADSKLSYNVSWKDNNILQISGTADLPDMFISALVYDDLGFETGDVLYADQTTTDNLGKFEFKTRINNKRGLKFKIGGGDALLPIEYFSKKTEKTVYLSDNGTADADGNANCPVSSLQRAFDISGDNAKIEIVGKYTLNENVSADSENVIICGGELVMESNASISGNVSFRNIMISSNDRAVFKGETEFLENTEFSETLSISGEFLFFECEPAKSVKANAVIFKNGIKRNANVTAEYIVHLGEGGKVSIRDGKLFAHGDDQRALSVDNASYTEKETELLKGEHTVNFGYDFLIHDVNINKEANIYRISVSGQTNNLLLDADKNTPQLFVGIYDGEKLTAIKSKTVGENKNFNEDFTFDGTSLAKFDIRVFLWDSFSKISPLTSVYITDNNKQDKNDKNILYVSPDGSDSAKGTFTDPLSLLGARNKARENDSLTTILLRGGEYKFTEDLVFDENDKKLVIRPYNGEKVIFSESDKIPASIFKKLPDGKVKNSIIDVDARDKILVADIREAGISNLGLIYGYEVNYSSGKTAPTLSIDGKVGTIARYPNKDENGRDTFLTIQKGTDTKPFNPGSKSTQFSFFVDDSAKEHMEHWSENYDHWACGYLAYTWADGIYKGSFKKNENGDCYFISNSPWKYAAPSVGGRVFFQNILEELDSPGEWYLERPSGLLYIYPYNGFNENSEIRFTVNEGKSIIFSGSSDIALEGIRLDNVKIKTDASKNICISDCEISGKGIDISKSADCSVKNNFMHDFPGSVIYVDGGDSETLTYANNIIENNIIKSYAKVYKCYTPAININGVGNVVSENEIYDAPHNAILLGGQMNLVELNYIHDVCLETSDSGAIYAGGTFSGQGNVIRYNYFENILRNALGYVNNAVYLDDMYSSAKVYGNIFYSCESAALLGGGRANEFYNNIVIDCANSITVDARGTWSDSWKETAQNRVNSLKNEFPYYNQGIWKEKFPHLSNVEEDEPELPKYNKVYNNVYYNSKAENIADSAYLSGTIKKNISLTDKKAFFDFDNKIFVPVKDGEVYQNIPDFADIPFELIGKTK